MTGPRPVTRASLRGPSIAEVDALNEAAREYAEADGSARAGTAAVLLRAADHAYGRTAAAVPEAA